MLKLYYTFGLLVTKLVASPLYMFVINILFFVHRKSMLPYMTLSQVTSRVKIMPPPLPLKLRREDDDKERQETNVHVPDYFNDSNV